VTAPEVPRVAVPDAAIVAVPAATRLSTELTDTLKSLTETLTGIKDVPSAEAALPKLHDFVPKLDAARATLQNLEDTGKASIRSLVQPSQASLKDLADRVLAIPGVGDKIKAVVDTIMAKLSEFAV
jgi:hypothetical protein